MDVKIFTPKIDTSLMQTFFELAKTNFLYSEFYKGVNTVESSPVLNKKQLIFILQKRFKLQEEKTGVYLVRSGGSTNRHLVFPVDIDENLNQRRAIANELTVNRIFTGETIALNIFGYSDMYRTAEIMDDILEKCQATTLALSAHATYKDVKYAADYFKPDFIMGTPSKLLDFAHFLETNNEGLNIANLLFAGEFLRPNLKLFLQQKFNFKQIYSLYGSAETGIWAWSDFTKHPSLFTVVEGIIVEIAEPDSDGFGMIVVTNTFRKRFPIFRYAIGDIGRWVHLNNKPYLELKSRETRSFIFCEQHYALDEFNSFLSEADAFQIQLSSNEEFRETLTLMIVPKVSLNNQFDFAERVTQQVKQLLNYNERFMQINVLLVTPADLYNDPVTTKTPMFLDLR